MVLQIVLFALQLHDALVVLFDDRDDLHLVQAAEVFRGSRPLHQDPLSLLRLPQLFLLQLFGGQRTDQVLTGYRVQTSTLHGGD